MQPRIENCDVVLPLLLWHDLSELTTALRRAVHARVTRKRPVRARGGGGSGAVRFQSSLSLHSSLECPRIQLSGPSSKSGEIGEYTTPLGA
jgi:hypothetical protein